MEEWAHHGVSSIPVEPKEKMWRHITIILCVNVDIPYPLDMQIMLSTSVVLSSP